MEIFRNILLWGSHNRWLGHHLPKWWFVKKAVKRFIPGEQVADAIEAAKLFRESRISTLFTRLGENITDLSEAAMVTKHYLNSLEQIDGEGLDAEVSLKLTQVGLDLDENQAHDNVSQIIDRSGKSGKMLWIDMESSDYTEQTLDFYIKLKHAAANVGLCLQSYLFRTENDLQKLLPVSPAIRLVKGAYKEPGNIAFKDKKKVDANFLKLSQLLLQELKARGLRIAFATHDLELIRQIKEDAQAMALPNEKIEFQFLYGIRTQEQFRLAGEGYNVRVLVSYGEAWFAWYMRRLAERPANVWFVLKNMFLK